MSTDLYNNPMVQSAKKALTPEQIEEYKKIGEYMYNNPTLQMAETGTGYGAPKTQDILFYAVQALKAGINPSDLTSEEIQSLTEIYGQNWYEKFGYEEDEVPKSMIQVPTASDVLDHVEKKMQNLPLDKKQKKKLQKKLAKERKKLSSQK